MATCLGNYAELLAPIGFSEDEITAHISDRSKSDPPLFDLQPREFLLRLFLRRNRLRLPLTLGPSMTYFAVAITIFDDAQS